MVNENKFRDSTDYDGGKVPFNWAAAAKRCNESFKPSYVQKRMESDYQNLQAEQRRKGCLVALVTLPLGLLGLM